MKRWLTLCVLGLTMAESGCALNECCQRNVCSHFGKPAETTRESAQPKLPLQIENRASIVEVQTPLVMPPKLNEIQAETNSAMVHRLPKGPPNEDAPPLVVQAPSAQPSLATTPEMASGGASVTSMRINLSEMEAAWLPKFRQPMPGSPDAAPAKPMPIERKSAPIPSASFEILNLSPSNESPAESRSNESRPSMRGMRTGAGRQSNYLPMDQNGPERPKMGLPQPSAATSERTIQEEPRATFGAATLGASECEFRAKPNSMRFGTPVPTSTRLPTDLFALQGNTGRANAIAPLTITKPLPKPTILAAIKARMRRPHFLDAPIPDESVVIRQCMPMEELLAVSELEITQAEAADDLPTAILPYVVIQRSPKVVLRPEGAPMLLEPEPQILDYRRADLGAPETR